MTREFSFLVDDMYKIKGKVLILLFCIFSSNICFSSTYDTSIQKADSSYFSAEELVILLQNYLKDRGFQSYPSIDKNKKLQKCSKPLKFFPLFESWKTVEVVCDDITNSWHLFIRTRAQSFNADISDEEEDFKNFVVVSNKSLSKGHILTKNDLKLIAIDKIAGIGVFNKVEDIIGRKLKQNVSLGHPIRSRHLHLNWVINKGDKIDIIQSLNTVFISASGVALENGQIGEKIRVMNISSKKNLVAWVLNEKKVSIQSKINIK